MAGITSEGAHVTELAIDYDDVGTAAADAANAAGPCGAATLAGTRLALTSHRDDLALPADATVLLSTEGPAANPLPEDGTSHRT